MNLFVYLGNQILSGIQMNLDGFMPNGLLIHHNHLFNGQPPEESH